MQVLRDLQQVAGVASQAIQLGHHHHVSLTHKIQHQRELRAVILGPAHFFLEYLAALGQCLKLGIQALPHRADTCISHQCHGLLLVNRARYTDATCQKVQRNPCDRQKVLLSLASHGLGLLTDRNENGPFCDEGPLRCSAS
ncbi:hypothetical protein D3C76_1481370 [compost metagenome]